MLLAELNMIFTKINKSKNDYDLFIETGSFIGETLNEIKSEFNKIISIEITEKYSQHSKHRFANNSNIEIIKGDSVVELPQLINKYVNNKIIFFLDGHYSAGDTGKNGTDCPLIEELKIINEKCNNDVLIIIDDVDLFDYRDSNISWIGINEINILNTIKDRKYNYQYLVNIKPTTKKRLIIELNK